MWIQQRARSMNAPAAAHLPLQRYIRHHKMLRSSASQAV
jgi:hypothetical protein